MRPSGKAVEDCAITNCARGRPGPWTLHILWAAGHGWNGRFGEMRKKVARGSRRECMSDRLRLLEGKGVVSASMTDHTAGGHLTGSTDRNEEERYFEGSGELEKWAGKWQHEDAIRGVRAETRK